MVVIKIELWPNGNRAKRKKLGCIHITNDATGTRHYGNYTVKLFHAGIHVAKKGVFKAGRVRGFLRTLSPYRLIFRALQAVGET